MEKSVSAGGAESGAVGAHSGPIDPDLALLIDAWPRLPEAVRRQIFSMVKLARIAPVSPELPQAVRAETVATVGAAAGGGE